MSDPADTKVNWLSFIESLQSIAQTGMSYTKDTYDKERYTMILELIADRYSKLSGKTKEAICELLFNEVGYATPKICVRGLILKDNKVLLVKEREEALWSLPGGWAEVNSSPAESLITEIFEETGYTSSVERMLAFWDKQHHQHPLHWPHTYLAFYLCKITGGEMTTSHEISEVDYFNFDHMPELSTHRVTKQQIKTLMKIVTENLPVAFD